MIQNHLTPRAQHRSERFDTRTRARTAGPLSVRGSQREGPSGSIAERLRLPTLARECSTDVRCHASRCTICPLCITANGFRAFRRLADDQRLLSVEDVPPEKLGGRPLLLTCKDCNNRAGHRLDAEAVKVERISRTLTGTGTGLTRARLGMDGISINVEFGSRPGEFAIFGCPAHTSPKAQAAFFDAVERVVTSKAPGWQMQLRFPHPIDARRAALSWLRSAYLAGFAKFGYRLILGRAYGPLRESIRNAEAGPWDGFLMVDRELQRDEKLIIIIARPTELAGGLLVQMGHHVVALPGPNDVDFYRRLSSASRDSAGGRLNWEGTVYPWPKGPEFLLDHVTGDRPGWRPQSGAKAGRRRAE